MMDGSRPHGFRICFNVLLRYQLLENLTTCVFPTLIEVLCLRVSFYCGLV